MKPLVIDSSVIINWYVPQTYTSQALILLKQHQEGEWTFLASNHIYSEVGNGIWRLQRANIIKADDARTILEKLLRQVIHLTPTSDLLLDAYSLATKYDRSVYDSLYIALAQREKTQFVTADEKLFNAVGGQLPVTFLANWS